MRPEGAPRDGTEDIYESKSFAVYDDAAKWQARRTAEIKGDLEAGRPLTKVPQAMFGTAIRWGLDILDRRIEASRLEGRLVDSTRCTRPRPASLCSARRDGPANAARLGRQSERFAGWGSGTASFRCSRGTHRNSRCRRLSFSLAASACSKR